jgi:hypothetical protein
MVVMKLGLSPQGKGVHSTVSEQGAEEKICALGIRVTRGRRQLQNGICEQSKEDQMSGAWSM